VELAVAGQDAQRALRGSAETIRSSSSCVLGANTIVEGSGSPSSAATWTLRRGPDLAHHPFPFAVGEADAVLPCGELADIRGIGPEMVECAAKCSRSGAAAIARWNRRL
jgi:hypothetical protein